jgi:hypothetical protein
VVAVKVYAVFFATALSKRFVMVARREACREVARREACREVTPLSSPP